jgi:hypothetical protein
MYRKQHENDIPLSADVLWGVDGEYGIAAFLDIPVRKVRHLINTGVIPVRRHGHRTITASKNELRRVFAPVGE